MTASGARRPIDDEIIRNALAVAAEEAAIAVVRAAHSQFIVENSDAGVAVLSASGDLVAQAAATSILHSGGICETVKAVLEDFAPESLRDGDVFIVNDPYRGGVHANDVTVARPVLVDGELAFVCAALIHVLDLGGGAHGGINARAVETFEEGVQLPPLHLYSAGERNEELVSLLRLNSRAPDETMGDIEALVAGTRVCEQRLRALIAEHGLSRLGDAVERLLVETEARTRREIQRLPDGVYSAEIVIDDDAAATDVRSTVAVDVRVAGDEVVLDFSRSGDQVRASVNSSASQALDAAVFALRCFIDKDIPTNAGMYRPVRSVFRRGSLLDPTPPHPCGGRMIAIYAVVDAIVMALSEALPAQRCAQSGMMIAYTLAGVRSPYWVHNSFDFGGVGARVGRDGADATGFHFGVSRSQIAQFEPVEGRCPLIVERVETIVDSGGPGRWRGGLGVRIVYRLAEPGVLAHRSDHFGVPPRGLDGGGAGGVPSVVVVDPDGRRHPQVSKVANVDLAAGSRLVVETAGGGGLGHPFDRPADAVARDVVDERVSVGAARRIYGVVVGPDGAVDGAETDRVRRGRLDER